MQLRFIHCGIPLDRHIPFPKSFKGTWAHVHLIHIHAVSRGLALMNTCSWKGLKVFAGESSSGSHIHPVLELISIIFAHPGKWHRLQRNKESEKSLLWLLFWRCPFSTIFGFQNKCKRALITQCIWKALSLSWKDYECDQRHIGPHKLSPHPTWTTPDKLLGDGQLLDLLDAVP